MKRVPSYFTRLENILSGVERSILEAPDRDFRSSLKDGDHSAMRDAIAQKLKAVHQADVVAGPRKPLKISQLSGRISATPVSSDIGERLKLLRLVMASRPDIPVRLSSAFARGRRPTAREIENVTDELVRLGVLASREED